MRKNSNEDQNASQIIDVFFPFTGDSVGGSYVSALSLIKGIYGRPGLGVRCCIGVHKEGVLQSWLSDHDFSFEVLQTDWVSLIKDKETSRWRFAKQWFNAILENWLWLRRHSEINIVHVNDGRMVLTWAIPTWLAGRRFVIHQRTQFPRSRTTSLFYRLASKIVAVSEYSCGTLPLYLQKKTIVVDEPVEPIKLEHPVRGSKQKKANRKSLELSDKDIVIVLLGSVVSQKRQMLALKALRCILDSGCEDAKLILAGAASDKNRTELLSAIERMDLEEHAFYVGRRPAYDLLSAGDVLLAAGVNEGFGRTPAEAMICRVPVVASASGGHLDFVYPGETGWLYDADNPEDCASKIKEVVAMPETQKRLVIERGYEMAIDRFNPDRHAAEVAKVYGEIVLHNRRCTFGPII